MGNKIKIDLQGHTYEIPNFTVKGEKSGDYIDKSSLETFKTDVTSKLSSKMDKENFDVKEIDTDLTGADPFLKIDTLNTYQNEINDNVNSKADIIMNEVKDVAVVIDDNLELDNSTITVYGKCKQLDTPSPDNLVDVIGVGNTGSTAIVSCSRNVISESAIVPTTLVFTQGAEVNATTLKFGVTSIDMFKNGGYVVLTSDKDIPFQLCVQFYNPTTSNNWGAYSYAFIKSGVNIIKMPSYSMLPTQTIIGVQIRSEAIPTSDATATFSNVMVFPGDNYSTEYEPYTEYKSINIPLEKPLLGLEENGFKDRIVCKDGVYGIERNVGKVSLASASWSVNTGWLDSIDNYAFAYMRTNILKGVGCHPISNAFQGIADPVSINTLFGYTNNVIYKETGSYSGAIYVSVEKSKLESLDTTGFRKYMATLTDAYVILPLDTPTFEPFTDEIQESIKSINLRYGEVNTIYNSDSATMSITYRVDTKTYIDKKFNELEKALVALS